MCISGVGSGPRTWNVEHERSREDARMVVTYYSPELLTEPRSLPRRLRLTWSFRLRHGA